MPSAAAVAAADNLGIRTPGGHMDVDEGHHGHPAADNEMAMDSGMDTIPEPEYASHLPPPTWRVKPQFASWEIDHKRFEIIKLLGKGSYGSVAEAIDHVTGKRVAVKKINQIFEVCTPTPNGNAFRLLCWRATPAGPGLPPMHKMLHLQAAFQPPHANDVGRSHVADVGEVVALKLRRISENLAAMSRIRLYGVCNNTAAVRVMASCSRVWRAGATFVLRGASSFRLNSVPGLVAEALSGLARVLKQALAVFRPPSTVALARCRCIPQRIQPFLTLRCIRFSIRPSGLHLRGAGVRKCKANLQGGAHPTVAGPPERHQDHSHPAAAVSTTRACCIVRAL